MDTTKLIDVFLVIFIGMGPIKVLLVYLGATQGASKELQRKVAQKTVMTATVVAFLLLIAGAIFMQILHFTTGALNIAGGLILLLLAIYPLGMPLLLNPVGIVSLTVLSAETQDFLQLGVIALMVLAVAAIDFGAFLVSHRLDKYLNHERIILLEKLLGILLAALAVQMMLNGLAELGIITMTGAH
jgi:multiple antibiotic resistance protein